MNQVLAIGQVQVFGHPLAGRQIMHIQLVANRAIERGPRLAASSTLDRMQPSRPRDW